MEDETQQPTITLVVNIGQDVPTLAETLINANEMLELEMALIKGESDPVAKVWEYRQKQKGEDEEFADFVEGLLSQPFLKPEIQQHAIQWFKSRMKIESFQKAEDEASRVIAQYAFQIYMGDRGKTDFLLSGPKAKVRIRVIELDLQSKRQVA